MRQLLTVVCCAVCLVCFTGSVANAQVYVGAHGGVNFVPDSDIDGSGVDAEARLDPGFAVGGVLGYRFGLQDGVSIDVEGEFAYRLNDIDKISAAGVPDNSGGEMQSFAWMANAWLNWRIGDSDLVPYAGGGFGGVHIDIKDAEVAGIEFGNESDFVIGGQLGAGLGYQLGQHVVLSLDYRFLITEDASFQGLDIEHQDHAVMLGFKYLF